METIKQVKTIRNGKGGFMLLEKCDAPINEYCIPVMEGSMEDILKYLDENGFKVVKLFARTKRSGEN